MLLTSILNIKKILFYIIELLIIALTIFCLGIPYHYFQSLDSKLLTVYPVFLIIINLANPITVLEIDYEITNLEQLQNAKEVQHKLDKLLQNVQ